MSIEIPDWVSRKVLAGYLRDWDDCSESNKQDLAKIMTEALRAALEGWFAECGTTYYDTRDASLPTQVAWDSEPAAKTKVFTLRKDKTP